MDKVLSLTFPAGKILYTTIQTKAMTVGADTEDLTVPSGKVWLLHWGLLYNGSGAGIVCSIQVRDATGVLVTLESSTLADGADIQIPHKEGTEDLDIVGAGAYPVLLAAGQIIRLTWGADAGKSGNSQWYLMIREL